MHSWWTLLGMFIYIMCTLCRKLSCEACYNISDAGLQCLTACIHLSDLTISYCNQVGTHGMNWSRCLKKRTWPFYTGICYYRWRMLVWCVWLAWESWRGLLQELVQGYLTKVFKEVCTLCSVCSLPTALWHYIDLKQYSKKLALCMYMWASHATLVCNYFSISFIKQYYVGNGLQVLLVGVHNRYLTVFLVWDVGPRLSVMPAAHHSLQTPGRCWWLKCILHFG